MTRFFTKKLLKRTIVSSAFFSGLMSFFTSVSALNANIVNMSTHVSYADLQTAIDTANSGDTLSITGTQIGNFVINKDLTLKGSKNAILDGNHAGTVLSVGTINNIVVYIDNLSIQNGHAAIGGGILNFATLHLNKVNVTNNTSDSDGGGIYSNSILAHLSISNSLIENNTAVIRGGGIYNDDGSLMIKGSEISGNTSENGDGGGIYNNFGIAIVTISNTKFEKNLALNGNGGAFYAKGNETAFDHVKIKRNKALNGAGIYNTTDSILDIHHSKIEKNNASLNGGGIYNISGIINLSHSEIEHNNASETGGGILNNGVENLHLLDSEVKHNNPNNIASDVT